MKWGIWNSRNEGQKTGYVWRLELMWVISLLEDGDGLRLKVVTYNCCDDSYEL